MPVASRGPVSSGRARRLAGCGGGAGASRRWLVGASRTPRSGSDPAREDGSSRGAPGSGDRAQLGLDAAVPAPPAAELAGCDGGRRRAGDAGIRPIVAVYSFGAETPLTPRRAGAVRLVRGRNPARIPGVRDMSVGNEPNSNLFWQPQFDGGRRRRGRGRLLALLAADLRRAEGGRRRTSNVIGGVARAARQRQAGRRPPDALAHAVHPRPRPRLPCERPRRSRSWTCSRSTRTARTRASRRRSPTRTRRRSGSPTTASSSRLLRRRSRHREPGELPIVYGEYGVETPIPRGEGCLYTGREPRRAGRRRGDAGALLHGRDRLAARQPNVRMLFFFHVTDERASKGCRGRLLRR